MTHQPRHQIGVGRREAEGDVGPIGVGDDVCRMDPEMLDQDGKVGDVVVHRRTVGVAGALAMAPEVVAHYLKR